jgi:hypothetical protein
MELKLADWLVHKSSEYEVFSTECKDMPIAEELPTV